MNADSTPMNADNHSTGSPFGALIFAVGVAFTGLAQAATPVPSGKWSFVFTDRKGHADRPMRVYTYRPRQCDATCPIQFVLHGVKRNASTYRDHWELVADRHGLIIVAPEFSQASWPKGAGYGRGDVEASDDREKWAFAAIEHLFDEIRVDQKDYRLFGHSAGGQFVQRFLLFMPASRASVAISANAGWYTLPEWRDGKAKFKWPHSLAGAKVGEAEARAAFGRRYLVLLGEKDTDPNDPDLDKAEGSMAQGANRLERGEHFFAAATGVARDLGVAFRWELSYVPGVSHDGAAMSRAAAEIAYGNKR